MRKSRRSSPAPCTRCGKAVRTLGAKFCGFACRDAAKLEKRVRNGEARCSKCREWKAVEEFVKGRYGGVHSHCKVCNANWHVPPEKRKMAYRPAFRLTPEQKADNKREANQRQHHARRAAGKAPSRDELDALYCAQGARCGYCGDHLGGYWHVDHKQPVSKGGTNALENLHFTCPTCNMRKGNMTHEEFIVSKKHPARRNDGE